MKRKNLILLVLLLAIGFAAVSTTLILNGTLNIGENNEDFDVYFSKSIEDGAENNKLIKDDIHLEFSKDMSLVGEKYVLDYDVTNGSRNYDAEITINCTESNEYLKVTNEFDTSEYLISTETRRGKLTIEVLKPFVGDSEENTKDISISCEIRGNAVERDSLGSGTPADKVKQSNWEITEDKDNNGELSKGDLITLGTESFYVYDIEGDKVKALSQYNLHIGNVCTSSDISSCSQLENPTGLQSKDAIGAQFEGVTPTSFPWIGVTPFLKDEKIHTLPEGQKANDYNASDIKPYVDAYAEKLSELDGKVEQVRLMTKEELEAAGCDSKKNSCKTGYVWSNGNWVEDSNFVGTSMEFLYSTSYWTSSSNDQDNLYVWDVGSLGDCVWIGVNNIVALGVRPVIEISTSLFQ